MYRDIHDCPWRQLLQVRPQVRDYVPVLGLQVVVDEAEGYAFLRQRPADPGETVPHAQLLEWSAELAALEKRVAAVAARRLGRLVLIAGEPAILQ